MCFRMLPSCLFILPFTSYFFRMVEEVRTSGQPHVLKIVICCIQRHNSCKELCSDNSLMAVELFGANWTGIKRRSIQPPLVVGDATNLKTCSIFSQVIFYIFIFLLLIIIIIIFLPVEFYQICQWTLLQFVYPSMFIYMILVWCFFFWITII